MTAFDQTNAEPDRWPPPPTTHTTTGATTPKTTDRPAYPQGFGRDVGVSPFLLSNLDEKCPRYIRAFTGQQRAAESFGFRNEFAMMGWRNALREWLANAHRLDSHARTAALTQTRSDALARVEHLGPDVIAVIDEMAQTYSRLCAETPLFPGGEALLARPTLLKKRNVSLAGRVDLRGIDSDGSLVLRCLRYREQSPTDRQLETELIALRLFTETNTDDDPIEAATVDIIDLVNERRHSHVITLGDAAQYARNLDDKVAQLALLADDGRARMGGHCAGCDFQIDCPALESDRPKVESSRQPLGTSRSVSRMVSTPITLSPTSVDTWGRCRRQFRNRHLLKLPTLDASSSSRFGSYVHEMLRLIHADGNRCTDRSHVTDILDTYATDERSKLATMIERHSQRCPGAQLPPRPGHSGGGTPSKTTARGGPPGQVELLGQEVSRIRTSYGLPIAFNAMARFDALWRRDDVVEARDYKTGQRLVDRVADDVTARVQAWILEPLARREGRQLIVRQEYLDPTVGDDPEPFVPDVHDFAAIGEFLSDTALDIVHERDFDGNGTPHICTWCSARETCPDRADPDTFD